MNAFLHTSNIHSCLYKKIQKNHEKLFLSHKATADVLRNQHGVYFNSQ